MTDYKDTLNLPKTAFAMKANLASREPNILKHWTSIDLYQQLREHAKGRPKFLLHDGPPYANAQIHLGTAMNKILKDIIVKAKTLSGFDAPYVPGWDCHGLPIELKVEKKVGKPGAKLSFKEFRQACRDYAMSQVKIQMDDFVRLGVVADWKDPYLSLKPSYEANAVRALAQIINNGHVVRGQKPVHWCTACSSALAEAEVEYQDKTSPQIDVAFDVIALDDIKTAFNVSQALPKVTIPIWTTTPWTLPANQAVTVHAEFDYVLVECELHGFTQYLVVAKDLLESVMQRYAVDDYQVIAEAKGQALEHISLQHPFLDRQVPVILGEHVTTEAGTGNVHTAPAHGIDDYAVGRQYQLPEENPVDSRSCFVEGTPFVGGEHVFKANPMIIALLEERKKLLAQSEMQHSYPHCWRHKTPLIFRATPQWFISMEQNGLRKMALQAVGETHWIPAWGETRITKMIESRPDWCISRQRTWGIPITLFIHKGTGELHPNTPALMDKVADLIEADGIDAWYDVDATTLIGDDADTYDKVTDTLDVWFDSGVTHECVLQKRESLGFPADLYLEGSDQHRGWFQTSLLTALAIRERAPFKSVLTHGYVVDGKGHKMSKSVGNVVLPANVIKQLGADILRLWAAATDHTVDINFSDEILKRSADAYRRIRNTVRFLLSNLYDFNPNTDGIEAQEMVALDAWAIATTQKLQTRILDAYDRYHFQSIYQLIHNFCTVDLGSFYLDIIKDRLYTAKATGVARRSAQTAMFHIVEALVRWLAPILSFTAEEIWQHMPLPFGEKDKRTDSIFFETWYEAFPKVTKHADIDWVLLKQIRDEVNKQLEKRRQQGDIGSALETEVTLFADEKLYQQLHKLGDELHFLLIVSNAAVLPIAKAQGDIITTDIDGLDMHIQVTDAAKCERCWQRRRDVGSHQDHANLCGRCYVNVYGVGEERYFA